MNRDKRDVNVLRAYGFVLFMGVGTFFSFIYLYFSELGFNSVQIGILAALGPAVMMVVQPFWGWVSDLTGRPERVSVFLALGMAVGVGLIMLAHSFAWMILCFIIFYIFYSSLTPIYDSVVMDTIRGKKTSYGQVRWWGSVGFALTVLLVGNQVQWAHTNAVAVQNYIYLAILLAVIGIVLPRRQDSNGQQNRASEGSKAKAKNKVQLWPLFKNRELIVFLIAASMVVGSNAIFYTFFSFLFKEVGGGEGLLGVAMMVGAFAEIPFLMFSQVLLKRFKVQHMLLLAFAATALRWFLNSIATSPYQLMGIQLLHGLTFGVFYASAVTYIDRLVPEHLRSSGQTLFWAATYGFGNVIGNLAGGWIYQLTSVHILFALAGVAAGIGTMVMFSGTILPMRYKGAADKTE